MGKLTWTNDGAKACIGSVSLFSTSLHATGSRNPSNVEDNSGPSTVKSLLSAEECLKLYKLPDVKFVDASWHISKSRDARIEFLSERVDGATFFDIDRICDKENPLPHMLPTSELFASEVSDMGISSTDHVIVYTKPECFSAARVWWTFKVFGHDRVSILNGGLNAWKNAGGKVSAGALPAITKGKYTPKMNPNYVSDWKEVLDAVNTGKAQIVDARSKARFYAEAPEPRPYLVGGHIPGSLNLPFTLLVKSDDWTTFRSEKEIRDEFLNAGVIFGAKSILTCGTGITAGVLAFGLNLLGKDISLSPVYDGSWTEWGSPDRNDLPKMK